MSASSAKRRAWDRKFERLTELVQKATEDILVAVYEATEDGLSQADIAYMVGDRSQSGIKAKATKGEKILAERKRT